VAATKKSKARKKKFNTVAVVKEMARERIGTVPVTRRLEEKKSKPPKHKKALTDVVEEE
jgi:hypothetical protein